jgi:hypothetical protein
LFLNFVTILSVNTLGSLYTKKIYSLRSKFAREQGLITLNEFHKSTSQAIVTHEEHIFSRGSKVGTIYLLKLWEIAFNAHSISL